VPAFGRLFYFFNFEARLVFAISNRQRTFWNGRWTFTLNYDKNFSIMKIPENLKYDDKGLIPAVIQDWQNNDVLMVAYMNAASLQKTVETGLTWFWSRSRQKFWQKGETSGHIQRIKDILYDCDQDTLLIKVEQTGPACHTGARSCFFRSFMRQEGKP
jgi:phosphoribosyl-AMP cyclohydrolase